MLSSNFPLLVQLNLDTTKVSGKLMYLHIQASPEGAGVREPAGGRGVDRKERDDDGGGEGKNRRSQR